MGKKDTTKVFVFHYKTGKKFPDYKCYVPIWAGKNEKQSCSELIGDDSGDQISFKNKYYSELTGIYWAWKNSSSIIVGTSHYRRFFTTFPTPLIHKINQLAYALIGLRRKRFGLIYTSNTRFWGKKIINCSEIETLLSSYDAILPLPRKLKYTVETHFNRYHQQSDLLLLRTVIADLHPSYSDKFEEMLQQKRLYANNMFIVRRKEFDNLCSWLFSILFEFEKRVNLDDYNGYQERLFGFLSERLITLWFLYRKLNVKELPLIYFKHLKFQND